MSVGRSGFLLYFSVCTKGNLLSVNLHISVEKAEAAFSQLEQHKEEIEEEIGEALIWEKRHKYKTYGIDLFTDGDINVKTSWDEYFEWFEKYASLFYKAFSDRVKNLNL